MSKVKKISIILALATIVAVFAVFYDSDVKESTRGIEFNTEEWRTYTSEEFNFEIRHPVQWKVSESYVGVAPMITIHKAVIDVEEEPPFDHFANATHVSIYPKGIPTEGVSAPREEASVKLSNTNKANDLLMENGEVFASYYTFEVPSSWEPWGFLFARTRIENLETTCTGDCDVLFGDVVMRSGVISERDRDIIEVILQTFKFIQ